MPTASADTSRLVKESDVGAKLDDLESRLEEEARRIEEVWERLLDEDEDGEEEE